VARFGADRGLDTNFGQAGVAFIDLTDSDVTSVVADVEHGISVAGTAVSSERRRDAFVVRLDEAGHIDRSYGSNGVVWANLPSEPTDVRLFAQDGTLVVAGNVQGPSVAVIRLTRTGQLDATFGTGGRLDVAVGRGSYLVTPAGSLLVAGAALNAQGSETGKGKMVAFTAGGEPKTSFGANGVVMTDQVVRLGRVDGQERILGVIDYFDEANPGYSLTRLMPSGVPDRAFANRGTSDVVRGGHPYVSRIADSPGRLDLLVDHRADSSSLQYLDDRGSPLGEQHPESPYQFDGSDIVRTDAVAILIGTNRRGQGDFDPRYAAVWWPAK
jgi:hypothetical protein